MKTIILLSIQLIISVACFTLGKFVFPKIPANVWDQLDTLSEWAAKFVIWAREFRKDKNGPQKMEEVVKRLQEVAAAAGYEVTEDQLKAIAQTAYEAMKAGEAAAAPPAPAEATLEAVSTAPTIIINTPGAKVSTGGVAVATDNVPDGALEENPDGSVNVYDSAGSKVGTISREEAEQAAGNVSAVVQEE